MKYTSIILITIVMLLSSCHRSGSESDNLQSRKLKYPEPVNIDLNKIRERGSLIAIVDNSSTGYFIYKGRPMGYDYDLLKLFSDYLEIPLEIKYTPSIEKAFEMLNNG
jgi:membrane-bound lytic murein transglycosylase F